MTHRVPRSSTAFRTAIAALVVLALVRSATAQGVGLQSSNAGNPRATNGEINEETVWVFRARPAVTLESPTIRLGDVVEPLDAKLAAWPRLSRAIIGFVPVGQTRMVLDRDRIARVVNRAEAIPKTIRWFGPDQIQLTMVEPSPASTRPPESGTAPTGGSATIRSADYQTTAGEAPIGTTPDVTPVSFENPVVAKRMAGWILIALKNQQAELVDRFEVKLAKTAANNDALAQLQAASGVVFAAANTIDPTDPRLGDRDDAFVIPISVTGRSVQGPIDAVVDFQITPHPNVVAAARPLQRGHRVMPSDLKLMPLSRERWKSDYSSSIEDFVGMEVRGATRAGQPFSIQAVAKPLMVQRGELIELRVSGGSILVTTNAKTLSDGRQGELIEVETLEPRRRVVARVTGVGTAQITTRAPVVRNR